MPLDGTICVGVAITADECPRRLARSTFTAALANDGFVPFSTLQLTRVNDRFRSRDRGTGTAKVAAEAAEECQRPPRSRYAPEVGHSASPWRYLKADVR